LPPSVQDVELRATDGTAAGTARVADVRPGGRGSFSRAPCGAGGTLYFVADDGMVG